LKEDRKARDAEVSQDVQEGAIELNLHKVTGEVQESSSVEQWDQKQKESRKSRQKIERKEKADKW
jgi:hypothetical protein